MATATKGAELEVRRQQIDLAYRAIMDGEKIEAPSDPEVISRAIMERILAAESVADVLTQQKLDPWREMLDVPVEVRGFRLNPSGFEQGSSVYAVVDLTTMDDGTEMSVSCGGRNVLMQLVKLLELDALPIKCKLIGQRTSEGYNALWLQPV